MQPMRALVTQNLVKSMRLLKSMDNVELFDDEEIFITQESICYLLSDFDSFFEDNMDC
tara:strand:- start:356 stop:529 length:174 start_codon:yes stop_codon:yes gene_type:complete